MIDSWICAGCGQRRPDHNIDVYSVPIKGLPGSQRNYKYCNDNDDCFKKVVAIAAEDVNK